MARIAFVTGFILITLNSLFAQSPNQWINYGQQYFKVPVAKEGVYKLTYLQLQQSGFPVESANPQNIQLFHRGTEQAITVSGEDDAEFNPTDFIEFYGEKNDGSRDSKLYDAPSMQPHKYYNLFSDTTAYFLTIGSSAGKRMSYFKEANVNNLPAQSYFIQENLLILSENYAAGPVQVADVNSSNFDTGEGWTSNIIWQGQSRDFVLSNILKTETTAPVPQLELVMVGRSSGDHAVKIYVGASLRLLASPAVSGYDVNTISEAIQWSDIAIDGTLAVRVQVMNQGQEDYVSVSALKVSYARQPNADGQASLRLLTVPSSDKIFLSISNAVSGSTIYDISNHDDVSIIGADESSALTAVVPGAIDARTLYVAATRLAPANVTPVKFRNIIPGQQNYIIITHPSLRKPGLEYTDPVFAYADYRASAAGGSYDTIIVHTQQLYDQFNYGETSPLAIYEFLRNVSQSSVPKYLFIIGKGLEFSYNYYRSNAGTGEFQDYVPPGGFPGSDILYSVGIGGSGYMGGIPTGRLPATKPEHVSAYLNKVKETEALPFDNLWRKKLLHLSGGIEAWEPLIFKHYLESLQEIAEAPYLGAEVDAIAKQSREVQVINISKQVNDGVGLITFIGHSSTSTLDFDIGYVTSPTLGYNNRNKYPMMIMNGCEVGSFFYKFRMFGEDWVLADKLGATGFIAHNSYGVIDNLFQYSKSLYEVAFSNPDFIGKGIGDIKLESSKRYLQQSPKAMVDYSQVQQMILLGDPAMPLFGARKPDLELKQNNVSVISLNDKPLTATYDSFAIKMIVRNYGIVKPDLFKLKIERILPDNSSITYDSLLGIPKNSDTLVFIVRRGNEIPFGSNRFKITLDSDNIVDELNEDNNTSEIDFLFPINGTKNLYPADFNIVSEKNISLTFQSTDVYSAKRDFILQLDTANTFDSPFKKEYIVNGKVLALKQVELLDEDTVAYYWRTRLDAPVGNESDDWTQSSFTFISDGGDGWAQVHFPQFSDDVAVGLVKNNELRRFTFERSVLPVSVETFGQNAGKPVDATSVKIDGTEYNMSTQGWVCRNNTINLIAFDRKSTYPYLGLNMKWYEVLYTYGGRRMICGRQPFVINGFQADEVKSDIWPDMIDYVDNITAGDSVLLFTIGDAGITNWPDVVKTKLSEFGISSDQLSTLSQGEGVIIFGKKGSDTGSAKVFKSADPNPAAGKVSVDQTITGGYSSGTLTTWIGPAYAWQKVEWKVNEAEAQDQAKFAIYGKKLNGDENLLVDDATFGQDISFIDATEYPYIRLQFFVEDNTLLTPPQLENWIVHFSPVPEGVLLPKSSVEPITLQEGQQTEINFAFLNIGDKLFKSDLQVKYTLFNNNRNEGATKTKLISPPVPGDTTFFDISPETINMTGWNNLEVFVNPHILPEKYYDNNLIQLRNNIFIEADETSPVLDVTFDGKHISNGDLVSVTPAIRITLWDENSLRTKQDTVGVQIYLSGPCKTTNCEPVYIPFSGSDLKWFPANADHDYYIDFTPDLSSGQYTLSVEASDASGNKAASPYEISFVVDEEMKISFIDPHPNPFVYDLFYGFDLSGNTNADQIDFDVRDLAGRKLYSEQNINSTEPGHHEFYWAGIDNNFNQLKTGVYLTTLRVSVEGGVYTHQAKVVIVR